MTPRSAVLPAGEANTRTEQVRVLHVLASLDQQYGGPLRAVLDLCAAGESLGVASEVLGFGPLKVPDNPFPCERIHSLHASGAYCRSPQLRPWLQEHLRRFHGVVIHGMWLYPNWATALECRRAGKPYACFPHGMLEPWAVFGQGPLKAAKKSLYWLWRERHVCQNARQVLFTTFRERDLARRMVPLRPASSIVAPFGFCRELPAPVLPDRADLIAAEGSRLALFLGRIHPKKNVSLLIRAWAAARMSEDWRLVIAGSGDEGYVSECKSLVRELGVERGVTFSGFVTGNDRGYLLQRAEWFLLPSSQENFGIAVLEAVEHGCATAISNRVYLSEAFRPESVVLPVQQDAWTQFFRERMPDRAWRDETTLNDREHLLSRFAADKVAREWSDTWIRLFSTQPS